MADDFCWYELMTPDVDAARSYYGAVVGWNAHEMGAGDSAYTILSAGDRGVAGILPKASPPGGPGADPVWLGYVAVDNCDEAAERIARAGGAIHRPPADIPTVGRFAVVADPQGAIFYIMTPLPVETPPPLPPMTPGMPAWRELYADDWKAAFDFYSSQFGWSADEAMDMGGMGTYQLFAAGGDAIGGMMDRPESVGRPMWLFYFGVDDIDAAAERVTAHGGELLQAPQQVPGNVWVIQGRDPQGAMFALVGPRR